MKKLLPFLAFLFICAYGRTETGVPIRYDLPSLDSESSTYLVTLAIVDKKNPDWIISTFVSGQPRTVTPENKGRFTEIWNGLDDNFMPVPPGDYGVKGIYAPARKWEVDGEWHAITPKFAGGASPWLPSPDNPKGQIPFGGDPVNSPMRDVDVAPNGVAVFYYQYLENGRNCPMIDLNKPNGPDQFIRAFNSGGAGGGQCAATDGEMVWASSTDGGPKFVYRADGKSFGESPGANRRNAYLAEGSVTAMAAARNTTATKTYVYVAQRGKMVGETSGEGKKHKTRYYESDQDFVNKITVHDGDDGKIVATIPMAYPTAIMIQGDRLFGLSKEGQSYQIKELPIKDGLPAGDWQTVLQVPASITPADLQVDSRGRFYLSDEKANKVYQLDPKGKITRTFGHLDAQKPGTYDSNTFMAPSKLAVWKNGDGQDRLLVVENEGPNRVSEWDADSGNLIREFMTYQTKANNGYAIDPADASLIYLPGHGDWLTRFKIDYDAHTWKVDAVWPNVEASQRKGLDKPVAIRANGNFYLASEQNLSVYRLAGDRWLRSAGIVQKEGPAWFFWHDANGDGQQSDDELTPTTTPPRGALTYHGQKWLPDLSYIAMEQGGQSSWRLAPDGFDEHGNPIFTKWEKVWTDPIFAARTKGEADAVHGGNELVDTYTSDWMQADGSPAEGFYAQARGGKNFTANFGAQHKICHYIPDGNKGYRLKWRVGRTALDQANRRGELQGGMRIFKPINGILSVVDQSRSGVYLYTDEGLYVDTLFTPGEHREAGVYAQPGEFFAGTIYGDAANSKIYYASGKFTPLLYEMEGWSLRENPIRPLDVLDKTVRISAAQIAQPPEIALSLRGGAGQAKVARFGPALGGVSLDGSMTGWESAEPVQFASSKEQKVDVRCLYDPDNLYLRWHVRTGQEFSARPLPPLERTFTHDQGADTVSFYIQGDINASPGGNVVGRDGDARFVFGLFKKDQQIVPVGVGLYPTWPRKGGQAQTYRTPVGEANFAHVGAIENATMGYTIDDDKKGFVLAARIPRQAIPAMTAPFGGDLKTQVNFEATLGGHRKFWWANSDGSASRETYDEPSEARLYPGSWALGTFQGIASGFAIRNWMIIGPFGGPGAEKFTDDPRNKKEVEAFYENTDYPPSAGKVDLTATYSGDEIRGYWPQLKQVRWQPATVADLDTRVVVGRSSQVWFGSTWIYSPNQQPVDFDFQGHRMTLIRWLLNDQAIEIPDKEYVDDKAGLHRRTVTRIVTLQPGWNQVFFRAYNVGYTPFKVGLVVKAPADILWKLRFSGQPPEVLAQTSTP